MTTTRTDIMVENMDESASGPVLRVWRRTISTKVEYLTPEAQWVEVGELDSVPGQANLAASVTNKGWS